MNNRFIVPVLALGIAALGASASPSQAATATLVSQVTVTMNNGTPIMTPGWQDSVTMSDSGAIWQKAYYYVAKNSTSNYVLTSVTPGNGSGAGTFSVTVPASGPPANSLPGNGLPTNNNFLNVYVLNTGTWQNAYHGASWGAPTGIGTITNSNGTTSMAP